MLGKAAETRPLSIRRALLSLWERTERLPFGSQKEARRRQLRIAGQTDAVALGILLTTLPTENTIGKTGRNSGTIPSVYGSK